MTKQMIFLVLAAFALIEVSFAENNTTPPSTTAPYSATCVNVTDSNNVTTLVCPTTAPRPSCVNVTDSNNVTTLVCPTTVLPTTAKPGNGDGGGAATTTQGPTGTGTTTIQAPTGTGATTTQGPTGTGATTIQAPTGTGATTTKSPEVTRATMTQSGSGSGGTTTQSSSGSGGSGGTTTQSSSGSGGAGGTTTQSSSGSGGSGGTTTQSSSGSGGSGGATTQSSSGSGGSGGTTTQSSSGSDGAGGATTQSSSGGSGESTTVATPAPGESRVDGMWNEWSNWACEQCGAGKKTRTRSCTNPKPSGGGQTCSGDDEEKGDNCNPCSKYGVAVSLSFNQQFQTGMENPDSPETKAFCDSFENSVMQEFSEAERVENCTLRNGSIIVDFTIFFVVKSNASSAPVNFTKVVKEEIFSWQGNLGNFTFDPNSFMVTKVFIDGVTFGEWKADTNLCTSMCCGAGNVNVYENRTCTEVATSCTGLIVNRVIGCSPACDEHKKCPSSSSGVNVQISALTLILAALLLSLRMLH